MNERCISKECLHDTGFSYTFFMHNAARKWMHKVIHRSNDTGESVYDSRGIMFW